VGRRVFECRRQFCRPIVIAFYCEAMYWSSVQRCMPHASVGFYDLIARVHSIQVTIILLFTLVFYVVQGYEQVTVSKK